MNPKQVFITLAVDHIEQSIIVAGLANSREECEEHKIDNLDTRYIRVFEIKDGWGPVIYKWFRACGMTKHQAIQNINNLGTSLSDVLLKRE